MNWVLVSMMIARSFGRNPVNGGIPASEHNIINKIMYMILFFWLALICIVVFMFEYVISKKIGVTVIKYSAKYVIHSVGDVDRMIIHPK